MSVLEPIQPEKRVIMVHFQRKKIIKQNVYLPRNLVIFSKKWVYMLLEIINTIAQMIKTFPLLIFQHCGGKNGPIA